jgi:pimeloyl-ACP methyl ester carboxylesterase
MIRSTVCLALACSVCVPVVCDAQQSSIAAKRLPAPTGKYAVGRIGYDWIDKSHPEPLSKIPNARREIMVYLWYPTEKGGEHKAAEYVPGLKKIAESPESEGLKEFWGDAWPVVESGQIEIDTSEDSPIVRTKERFPLIVFSPGLGVNSTAYTTLIQEVVSRGYIVASIEPTYEVPAVAFPDGRIIRALDEAMGRHQRTPPGETREQFVKRMHAFDAPHFDKWAADVRFTIDHVTTLNTSKEDASPFSQRLDLTHIAAWGHSFGGRAAARACQLDKRITACLNADGLGPDGPIFTYKGASLPSQPFLWMEVFHEPPTEAQLAPYKMTRKDWDRNHQAQLLTNEQQLKACPGGSYYVSINLPGIEHSSFSDQPLIQSEEKEDTKNAARSLAVIEEYTIAFFDRYLKQRKSELLDGTTRRPAGSMLEQFGPPHQ